MERIDITNDTVTAGAYIFYDGYSLLWLAMGVIKKTDCKEPELMKDFQGNK